MNERADASQAAEAAVANLFREAGWKVARAPAGDPGGATRAVDLLLVKRGHRFAAEIKSTSEARVDRVLPLLSQAILQSHRHAERNAGAKPLAIVHLKVAPGEPLIRRFRDFHANYAPDTAVGLVSDDGFRHFSDRVFADMNAVAVSRPDPSSATRARHAHDPFSDLGQWLLKVLLAPELPENLLTAPRDAFKNVSQLAQAADVSVMTAFRLVERWREEGFVEEGDGRLRVVRRRKLFEKWRAAATRSSPELARRFILPGAIDAKLDATAKRHDACIGTFAAARRLGLGHVQGALPCLFVRRLSRHRDWQGVEPASAQHPPQFTIKQATAPNSMFRGAVLRGEARVTDVIQTWLDVRGDPARGIEQAAFIEKRVLDRVIGTDE